MKKFLNDSGVEELLHRYQNISIIGLGITILLYFTVFDFTHHSSQVLLGIMAGFAIVVFGIGSIWLVKDIKHFSKAYKPYYDAQHKKTINYINKEQTEQEKEKIHDTKK